jgi:hypothetical protein
LTGEMAMGKKARDGKIMAVEGKSKPTPKQTEALRERNLREPSSAQPADVDLRESRSRKTYVRLRIPLVREELKSATDTKRQLDDDATQRPKSAGKELKNFNEKRIYARHEVVRLKAELKALSEELKTSPGGPAEIPSAAETTDRPPNVRKQERNRSGGLVKVIVTLADGTTVPFDVDTKGRGSPGFVLGIRKCGSTLLNKICLSLAKLNEANFVDVAGSFFRADLNVGRWVNDAAVQKILRPGNVYGGFRNIPHCLRETPSFANGRKVLMIRDPRDAMVSEYFSNAYSHAIPSMDETSPGASSNLLTQRKKALESTIDDYVRGRAKLMRRTFFEYESLWSDPNVLRLRYEDVIFAKRELIEELASFFGWTCSEEALSEILEEVDITPETENPHSFVRRVSPGDHLEKLMPETISCLNSELEDVLRVYGYAG